MTVSPHRGPILIAVAATVAVIATLGPQGSGPGVTCDEAYHVAAGKQLVAALEHQGLAFFHPENIRTNFSWPENGPPVQGPLGHWILGGAHRLFDSAPNDPLSISIAGARFAPALCFGLLVLVVGMWGLRLGGPIVGNVAAVAVVLSPRLFAHAHFAALDTITTLFFAAALGAVAEAARRGRTWHFAVAGAIGGMAVLVRLHGLLLLPPVAVWLAWRFRAEAWRPMLAWFAAGAAVVFAGWPWLWLSPISHFWRYVASGADRTSIQVFYLGTVWADRDVPWHYPAAMFLVTVPLGLLLLGALAARGFARETDLGLIGGAMLFVLAVFSWPGVPVYDGVRLFLMVFPLWALFVGVGAQRLIERPWVIARWPHKVRLAGLAVLLAAQGLGLLVYHPCGLSYYNLLSGGLWGASRLGFEVSYWGDAVREPMLAEAVERSGGGPVLFGPSLAPFQFAGVNLSSPSMLEHRVELRGWNPAGPEAADSCRVAVVYHRRADLGGVGDLLERGRVVEEYASQGVWLARLIELRAVRVMEAGIPVGGPRVKGTDPSTVGVERLELSEEFVNHPSGSPMQELSHFDAEGAARMVDVGQKPVTRRLARASGRVRMRPETAELIRDRRLAKGDVLQVARVAGMMAAKRCGEFIPLCHSLPLDAVRVSFGFPEAGVVAIEAVAEATARTGVEMEALLAVSTAGLTIYDMCKSVDREMAIGEVRLEEKSGGSSGHFVRSS